MSQFTGNTYRLRYDPLNQQVDFEGILRLAGDEEVSAVLSYLAEVHDQVSGTLRLSFRRLRYINAEGMRLLSLFVAFARGRNALTVKLVASSVLAWSMRLLPNLRSLWDGVELAVHDQDFYGSQEIIEDTAFIPLLRNQTRIIWPQEREILERHGLRRGMRVADICCGCGDVALLVAREFSPRYVLGVDHSEPAIGYARNLQNEFELSNVEFQRGDATALMIEDNSFDFVSCRLSLQIFSHPEQIMRELVRITRPGGRIYVTGEDYDLVIGHPEEAAVRYAYERTAAYASELGVDLRSGRKLFSMLTDMRLETIQSDHIVVSTTNTDREAFATVVESWRDFTVEQVGGSLDLSDKDRELLSQGYAAHLRSIRRAHGYAAWTIIACSGKKPLR
ncbi:MAG: methyltransferase domain-containing protein [Oscillochloris sp.]|nr:methyltransferase domain-containing protein [Oscillochloris sp.]